MKDLSLLYTGQDNAMTEIALALAMGFFSLMVLTLVSMGNGETTKPSKTAFKTIDIAEKVQSSTSKAAPEIRDTFVVHYNQNFFDRDGAPIDPASIKIAADGRLVLIVEPNLSLHAIMKALAAFRHDNVVVAEMDNAWSSAMKSQDAQR